MHRCIQAAPDWKSIYILII